MSVAVLPSTVQRNTANSRLNNVALTSGNNFGARHRDRFNYAAWLSQAILVKDNRIGSTPRVTNATLRNNGMPCLNKPKPMRL
jgi:hypothetical protein